MMEQSIRTDRDLGTLVIEGDVEKAEEAHLTRGDGDLLFVGCIRGSYKHSGSLARLALTPPPVPFFFTDARPFP